MTTRASFGSPEGYSGLVALPYTRRIGVTGAPPFALSNLVRTDYLFVIEQRHAGSRASKINLTAVWNAGPASPRRRSLI